MKRACETLDQRVNCESAQSVDFIGEPVGIRTRDLLIKSLGFFQWKQRPRWPKVFQALAVAFVLAPSARADGIAAMLMPDTPPCDMQVLSQAAYEATVQGDAAGLYTSYLGLRLLNCGNPYDVAGYVPGDPVAHWGQPDPLPSPVSIPAAGWLMMAALGALVMKGRW